jgi:hypothetical protein
MVWPRFVACASTSRVDDELASRHCGAQRQIGSIVRGFWFTPEIASYHRGCTDTRPIVTVRHDSLPQKNGSKR